MRNKHLFYRRLRSFIQIHLMDASRYIGCWIAAGKLVGDTLLAAAFVSYAGPFTIPFRKRLVEEQWGPDLAARGIPLTLGRHPLELLAGDAAKVHTFWNQHTNSIQTGARIMLAEEGANKL